MSEPTLEDLRDDPHAAWLWDGTRARIVWANAAGIAFFGGGTLFDLIDRPFDRAESGVARIASLLKSLTRGQSESLLLHFPSAGSAPVPCKCLVHALTDGRPGILVITEPVRQVPSAEIALAFGLLPTPAVLLAEDGRILNLNEAAEHLLGDLQTAALAEVLADKSLGDDLMSRAAKAGTVSIVHTTPARVGPRDLRITLKRLTPPAEGYVMTLDDVTERRALEQKLAAPKSNTMTATDAAAFEKLGEVLKAETALPVKPPQQQNTPLPELIRASLDKLKDANLITRDGTLVYANPQACQFFGYADLDAALADATLGEHFGALDLGTSVTRFTDRHGTDRALAAHVSVIAWAGGPARQISLRPVGEQKPAPRLVPPPPANEADAELRAILDTAADGIITLDAKGRIHTFSAGAEAIFGYRIAEVAGKPFEGLIHGDSRKTLRDYLASLQGPGLAAVFNDGREITAVVKQGGTVPLFLTLGPLRAPKSPAAFCAVVRDITSWKKTESELREAKEKAEASSRQKSEFLARISHELRTPLNAIMGFSEVMRMQRFGQIENEKYRGYVNDIHDSGSHLLSLINDLLDLSKVEAGKLELNFASVNLSDAADHAMQMLKEQAASARVVLRKAMLANQPNVVADLRSMRQIMLNLVSNALKFTDPGGQIIISSQLTQNGELVLRIKDTGIGMNTEQLRDALEPFARVSSTSRDTQGTGLGLPLTKALTEANRAQFSISSEPRKGTLVEITFPTTRVLAE